MAITNASRLADFGSGIGTQGAILQVNNATQRVGIGTTNPVSTLEVNGTITGDITSSGVSTFTTSQNTTVKVGTAVTIDGSGANITGVVTATSFEGDGSNLTGVSGFGTALNSTQGTLGNLIYKTPRKHHVAAGTTVFIQSDNTSGNVAFTRLSDIWVAAGATVHVAAGTTFVMDVLNIFS